MNADRPTSATGNTEPARVKRISADTPDERQRLLSAIGDTPLTVLHHHLLARGWGRAFVAGDPSQPEAAIVESALGPDMWPAGEPAALGTNPNALWSALQQMDGWSCVLVDRAASEPLGALIHKDTGRPVRYYGEIWLTLRQPVTVLPHPHVRLLTPEDAPTLERANTSQLRGEGWPTPRHLLHKGIAAGAIEDGHLIALSSTCASCPHHAELQIYTLESHRGRGLAAAAASLVAQQIQVAGQVPVWGAGEDNHTSLHIARKLGFTEAAEGGRRTYVIPQRPVTR